MADQNFAVIRLGADTTSAQIEKFVAMMQRMYDFHATLHPDWQTRSGWQQGSEKWVSNAGRNDEYFFAAAYPLNATGTIDTTATPAGYVIASFHYEAPLFIQHRYGYIADLWVEEAHRKQGIARQLLVAATAWFKEQGINRVQLEVDVKNVGGQKFWHSLGFEDFEIVMRADI